MGALSIGEDSKTSKSLAPYKVLKQDLSRYALIGSYNLDPRSGRLNTEIAVILDDPRIAAEVRRSMDRKLDNAWRIGPDGKPEGHDERYPGASFGKKLKVRLIRLFLPILKPQL